jgi:hypothetical protein
VGLEDVGFEKETAEVQLGRFGKLDIALVEPQMDGWHQFCVREISTWLTRPATEFHSFAKSDSDQ